MTIPQEAVPLDWKRVKEVPVATSVPKAKARRGHAKRSRLEEVQTPTAFVVHARSLLAKLVPESPDRFAEIRNQIDRIRDLGEDWNGYGAPAPSTAAIAKFERVLDTLLEAGFEPERVVADAEGGIAAYFFGGTPLAGGSRPRYAKITVDNEGDILILLHKRDEGEPEAWQVPSEEIEDALVRIREFVRA